MKAHKNDMGAMATSLQRDRQLESILAITKHQLGIGHLPHDTVRISLAVSIGFDLGRRLSI